MTTPSPFVDVTGLYFSILHFCFVGANIDTSSTTVRPSTSTFSFAWAEWWMRLQRCCRVSSSNDDQSWFLYRLVSLAAGPCCVSPAVYRHPFVNVSLLYIVPTFFLIFLQSKVQLHLRFTFRQWFLCSISRVCFPPFASHYAVDWPVCWCSAHRFFVVNSRYAEKVIPSWSSWAPPYWIL